MSQKDLEMHNVFTDAILFIARKKPLHIYTNIFQFLSYLPNGKKKEDVKVES